MSEADKVKRKALEILEDCVRKMIERCQGDFSKLEVNLLDNILSPEEEKEIGYMIPKLKVDKIYFELFCKFRGISY